MRFIIRSRKADSPQQPRRPPPRLEPLTLAHSIVEALEDKKGGDILLLDLKNVGPIGEYYVICSGSSERTLKALMDAVAEDTSKKYRLKPRLEGRPSEGWLLADYGSVIVHVFSHSQRDYYRLEELWSAAKVLLHLQ